MQGEGGRRTAAVDGRVRYRAFLADPVPDAVRAVEQVTQPGQLAEPASRQRCRVGEQVARAGSRQRERRVVLDVVSVDGDAGVFLAPAVRVLRDVAALEHRRAGVGGAQAAVQDLAQCVDAGRRHVVEEVAAPFVGPGAGLVVGLRARVETPVGGVVLVALERVEIAVVVDRRRLVADVERAVAIEVRGVVVGLVIELVVAAEHDHVERRHALVQEQRHVADAGRRLRLRDRERTERRHEHREKRSRHSAVDEHFLLPDCADDSQNRRV